jgi:hypothetical protein
MLRAYATVESGGSPGCDWEDVATYLCAHESSLGIPGFGGRVDAEVEVLFGCVYAAGYIHDVELDLWVTAYGEFGPYCSYSG